jgi:O-antigen/teichoic acid export membrane protein
MSRVIALAAHFFLCLRLCPALGRTLAFNRSLVRSLLGFGGWVTLSAAIVPILTYFDRFLIGSLLSVAAVGYYTPPYTISSRLTILPASLSATLLPGFSASAGRGDGQWVKNALVRSLKCLILIVGPATLLLAFFARPVLTLWVGPKFAAEGSLVLQILAIGLLANSLTYVPFSLLQGVGRPDVTAKLQLVEFPLCIGLIWFLVARFGLPGAALAWTIRVCLEFLMLIVAACWLTRTPARLLAGGDLLQGVLTLAALAAGLAVLHASTQVLVTDACFTLLLIAGFLLGAWRYVLDAEERQQIRQWLRVVS